MNSAAVITFLLVGVATVFSSEGKRWVDYRMAENLTFLSRKNSIQVRTGEKPICTQPGRVCDDDCQRIWICANLIGELQPSLIDICPADKTCNAGSCSATPTPECSPAAKKAFVCQAEGAFPDPITCNKYHYCIKSNGEYIDYPRSCELHYGYNAGTTHCSKKLVNNHCGAEYPVPVCTMPGQTGALKDNKSLYYICALYENAGDVLYPYLYLCPRGQEYDGNYNCK